ncbi:hypothetical protein ABS71_14385 [bacterium SCN 62-11]|nr:type II secretion system protein [Candidatus Eremiobacteraeota bacterium]ODT63376.1 MAG: hypothetical protein ABS71_14385 [bacterium SCN 62-11]
MRPRAYSLAEVMVAIGVLSIGLLAIAGSVIYSTRMGGRAGRATEALHYANQMVDLSKLYNLPKVAPIQDAAAARRPINAPPFDMDIYANDLFRRNIHMTWVNSSASDYRNELYQVDVTIYWFEKNKEESLHVVGLHRCP